MNNTSIKIVLEGRAMSDNKHAVYLQVIKNRKRKLINLGFKCQKSHFKDKEFTKDHPNYKIENELLAEYKAKALKIVRELELDNKDFTLKEFEDRFRGKKNNQNYNVESFYDELVEDYKKSGRMSTAKAYKDTKVSLLKFFGDNFKFKDITPMALNKYEVFLRQSGGTDGGISFRMRNLRAVFNKAIKQELIPENLYPFKTYKVSKLKPIANKTALSLEEFKKIKNIDLLKNPHLIDAYNYFMFSVFTRGMNFQDMMLLKWNDIRNGRIYYTRSKTKKKINLEVIEPVQEILNYYKAQKRPTQYVFPILTKEKMTPQQIMNRKVKVLKIYNESLKEIAKKVNVDKNITSYVGRHSFATILKMIGTPIEKISEMMGHSDVSITIAYLKEFSDEDLDRENRKLLEL